MSDDAPRANEKPEHLDRLSSVWGRVYERKIAQWSVAYVAIAYAIQHGVVLTEEAYEWPHAVQQISMLLLTLGVPLVMTFAWYHGERASRRISGPELTIIAILLAIGSLFFYVLVKPEHEAIASRSPAVQEAGVAAARSASLNPGSAISVAVLPFLDLSPSKDQDFFSDGMTEEITAALAKVPDLRVVARTSAFEFKGKNVNIKTMGEQLGATHLIEGSVRKAGNRLRITAQLIKSDDGTHIWAEDYDRELTDVFAIQEEIARAITTSLHMTLGLKPGQNLVNNRDIDPESYEKFLRAKALNMSRGGEPTPAQELRNITQGVALLEEVVAKNPGYAPAWMWLGGSYFVLTGQYAANFDPAKARALGAETIAKGEAAQKRAIQLDPNAAEPYANLGWYMRSRGDLVGAEDYIKKALALDPLSAEVMFINTMFAASAGHLKEALDFAEKGHALDPLYPNLARQTVEARWVYGQNDAAIALAKTLRPNDRATWLAIIYASTGRFSEASDALMELAGGDPNAEAAKAARLIRVQPAKPASADALPRLGGAYSGILYAYLGAPEETLQVFERRADIGFAQGSQGYFWHPALAPVRKTERFKTLMRKLGLVEYWKAKGWPQWCHPVGADDFACE